MRPRVLLALAMAGVLVVLSVSLGSASPDATTNSAVTPPTSTPSAKGCSEGSRACMKLEVVAIEGINVESACTAEPLKCEIPAANKFTLAAVMVKPPAEGYVLAQSAVAFGDHLVYKPAEFLEEEIVLLACPLTLRVPIDAAVGADWIGHQCLTGLTTPLPIISDDGSLTEMSVNCSSVPSTTIVELLPAGPGEVGANGAMFVTGATDQIIPDIEHITINCAGGATDTPTPTGTLTPSATATQTDTPAATNTPSDAGPTHTPDPNTTPTLTPTQDTNATPTIGATGTSTPDAGPSPTAIGTAMPPATESATPSATLAAPTATFTPSPVPTVLGDVSCDGVINPTDALFILQLFAGLLTATPCPEAADVNGDGDATPVDATLILQYSAGLITSLPP